MDIRELYNKVRETYTQVNDWTSEGDIAIIDRLFPNHDGKQDVEFAASLMGLRQELYGLRSVCKLTIEQIGRTLGDYGITTMQELADYINSEDYNQLLVNDIIKANGWDDLCGTNDYDICTNGAIKVTLDENTGEAKVV